MAIGAVNGRLHPLLACLVMFGCHRGGEAAPGPVEGEPAAVQGPPAASGEEEREGPAGRFELRGDAGSRAIDWSEAAGNLVFCRHDPRAEGGDYVWIRLAARPEQDGDAGPRLDIDLCRLTAIADGERVEVMNAGEHGSHCRAQPGVAIWWHEGDDAYNNGAADRADCTLTLHRDGDWLDGRFSCGPLREHAQNATQPPTTQLSVTGSFHCPKTKLE